MRWSQEYKRVALWQCWSDNKDDGAYDDADKDDADKDYAEKDDLRNTSE